MATQGIGNATPEQNKKFDANFDGATENEIRTRKRARPLLDRVCKNAESKMRLRELSEFTEEQLQNLDQGLWDESIDVLQMIEGELKKPEIMNPAILRAEGEEEARGDVVKKATIEADSSGPIASDDPNTSGGNEEVDDSNDGEAVNSEMEGVEPSAKKDAATVQASDEQENLAKLAALKAKLEEAVKTRDSLAKRRNELRMMMRRREAENVFVNCMLVVLPELVKALMKECATRLAICHIDEAFAERADSEANWRASLDKESNDDDGKGSGDGQKST